MTAIVLIWQCTRNWFDHLGACEVLAWGASLFILVFIVSVRYIHTGEIWTCRDTKRLEDILNIRKKSRGMSAFYNRMQRK